MPNAPRRFCATAGCSNRVTFGHCPEHADTIRRRHVYANTDTILYGRRWRVARAAYLGAHPYCASCGRLANEVDHVTPHRGDRDLFWDESNWQALCRRCHSRKTRDETLTVG